jgi:hypothetical protein
MCGGSGMQLTKARFRKGQSGNQGDRRGREGGALSGGALQGAACYRADLGVPHSGRRAYLRGGAGKWRATT